MRTSAIIAALLCCCMACDEGSASAPEPAVEGRVNAVISTKKAPGFADLCDVAPAAADNKQFTWPGLLEPAPASKARYRWVNVWATWCKPCIEELPLLTQTLDKWRKQNQDVTLTLVSVDADAAAAKAFIAQHGVPASLQVSDASQTTAWLASLGLQSGSAIPVHILVGEHGELLCARSGSLSESDLERFHHTLFP